MTRTPCASSCARSRAACWSIVEDRGRGLAPSPDGGGPGLGLPLIAALTEDLEISHGPDNRGSRVAMSFAP